MKRICFLRPQLLNSATVFHTLVGEWLLQWQWQCSNVTTMPLQAPVELRNPETWEQQQQPPVETHSYHSRVHCVSLLLQQSNLSAAAEYFSAGPQQRPMPTTTTPPLHCFIFSHCSFTDFSQKITIKVSPQKGLEWLQFHRIQRLFYLLQYTSILVLVYISIHRRMVASKLQL